MINFYKRAKKADADYFGGNGNALHAIFMVIIGIMPYEFLHSRITNTEAEFSAKIWRETKGPAPIRLVKSDNDPIA